MRNEDEWDYDQIGKLVRVELAGELGEDKAGCEDHGVELGDEFLAVCVEHAGDGDEEAWQSDEDDFKDGFRHQTGEVEEVGVRFVCGGIHGCGHGEVGGSIPQRIGHGGLIELSTFFECDE